jgi:hypothetical protein
MDTAESSAFRPSEAGEDTHPHACNDGLVFLTYTAFDGKSATRWSASRSCLAGAARIIDSPAPVAHAPGEAVTTATIPTDWKSTDESGGEHGGDDDDTETSRAVRLEGSGVDDGSRRRGGRGPGAVGEGRVDTVRAPERRRRAAGRRRGAGDSRRLAGGLEERLKGVAGDGEHRVLEPVCATQNERGEGMTKTLAPRLLSYLLARPYCLSAS